MYSSTLYTERYIYKCNVMIHIGMYIYMCVLFVCYNSIHPSISQQITSSRDK